MIPLCVEGQSMKFILDTAASVSVIGENIYQREFSHIKLNATKYRLLRGQDTSSG
jgi:predicted aspartyl protease